MHYVVEVHSISVKDLKKVYGDVEIEQKVDYDHEDLDFNSIITNVYVYDD